MKRIRAFFDEHHDHGVQMVQGQDEKIFEIDCQNEVGGLTIGIKGHLMVLIDYPQLMKSTRRKENRQQEVAEISRELKILSNELQVPVIALSQLSREIEHRSPPIPVLSDLRDSGSLEQDADLVMFIYRGDIHQANEGGVAKLIVAKQRNGPTDEVHMSFHRTFARFDELAEQRDARRASQRVL